jgi:hypothetical protein
VFLALILYEVVGGINAPNSLVTEKGLAIPTEHAARSIPQRIFWRREKCLSHAGNATTITHSSGP